MQQLETRNVPEIFLTNETRDQNYTITIKAKFKVEELIIAAQESTQVPVRCIKLLKYLMPPGLINVGQQKK